MKFSKTLVKIAEAFRYSYIVLCLLDLKREIMCWLH